MRTVTIGLTAALLMASASPALARQSAHDRAAAALDKEIAGRVEGKPVRCLSLSAIDNTRIIDGTAIIYRTLGNKIYVNRPLGAQLLHEDDIPVLYVYGSEICNLDRVKLLDRTTRMEHGSVGLGEFVPYTKPPKAK
jgi:hypothetical protein